MSKILKKEDLNGCYCLATPMNVNKLLEMGFPFVSKFPNFRFIPMTLTIHIDGVGQSTATEWEDKTKVELMQGHWFKTDKKFDGEFLSLEQQEEVSKEKVHLCPTCDDEVKKVCSFYANVTTGSVGMFECDDYIKAFDLSKHICDKCVTTDELCPHGLKRDQRDFVVSQCNFAIYFNDDYSDIKVIPSYEETLEKMKNRWQEEVVFPSIKQAIDSGAIGKKDDSKASTNFSSRFMPDVKFRVDDFLKEMSQIDSDFVKSLWKGVYWGMTDKKGELSLLKEHIFLNLEEVSIFEAIPEFIPEGMRYNKKLDKLVPDVLDEDGSVLDKDGFRCGGIIPNAKFFVGYFDKFYYLKSTESIVENDTKKIGGDGNSYYDLPVGAAQLQDLIEFKNMNGNVKDVFKACYRLGEKSDTEDIYDLEKICYYGLRELGRVKNTKDYISLAKKIIGKQNDN